MLAYRAACHGRHHRGDEGHVCPRSQYKGLREWQTMGNGGMQLSPPRRAGLLVENKIAEGQHLVLMMPTPCNR
jgi:hypothetical protein